MHMLLHKHWRAARGIRTCVHAAWLHLGLRTCPFRAPDACRLTACHGRLSTLRPRANLVARFSRSRRHPVRVLRDFMDEVVPKLWIGELPSCLTPDYLAHANIHWIVSCMRNPPAPPPIPEADGSTRTIPEDHVLVIPMDDQEDTPAYIYFSQCNKFLANALHDSWEDDEEPTEDTQDPHYIEGLTLRNGRPGLWSPHAEGAVLVHCQAGCSRSVTVRLRAHPDGCCVPHVESVPDGRASAGPDSAPASHGGAQRGIFAAVRWMRAHPDSNCLNRKSAASTCRVATCAATSSAGRMRWMGL